MPRMRLAPCKREEAKVGSCGPTSARHRLFAAAYFRNGGNGQEAAREAGYRGTDASLRVTASRLLRSPNVREIFQAKVRAAEARIGGGVDEAEILARLTAQARADLTPFIRFITPAEASLAVQGCGKDTQRAARILAILEHRAWYIDVEAAVTAGHGAALQEIALTTTATTLPELKIRVRDPLPALRTLAQIKGLLREKKPPVASPPSVTMAAVLHRLPTETLVQIRAAMGAANAAEAARNQFTPGKDGQGLGRRPIEHMTKRRRTGSEMLSRRPVRASNREIEAP